MTRMRVIFGLIFGLGLLAFTSGSLFADGGELTDAQKRQIVAEEIEAEAMAETREEIKEAIPGHQEGELAAAHEGDAHAAGSHAEPNKNPLEFKKDLAFFTAVVFVLLFLVLWKFAWGPIATSLDRREQAVERQIAEAAENNEESKRLLAQYNQKLDQAKDEMRGILEGARRDAEAAGREIVDAAKEDAKAENQRALREIDAARDAALESLAERSAKMAVELAGKIVGTELRAADHTKLVEQAVERFASADTQKPR